MSPSWKWLTAALLLPACAANTVGTGEAELEERDGGRDAGRRDAGRTDASIRADASTPRPRGDASVPSGESKTCPSGEPHSCYVLTDDSPEGCPEIAPEIPLGLPALPDWELCNGGKVSAGQTCVWEGPGGGSANCLCDTGVHWLCLYL
ncbi:MAG: hypothetical protein ABW352_22390 [Polyangiales bacterium]